MTPGSKFQFLPKTGKGVKFTAAFDVFSAARTELKVRRMHRERHTRVNDLHTGNAVKVQYLDWLSSLTAVERLALR